jgi:hypothetical protein
MSPVSNPVDGPAFDLGDSMILGINTMISTWLHIDNLIQSGGGVEPRHETYPYVVTNAIWVDTNGGGYVGPGAIPGWFKEKDVPEGVADLLGSGQGQAALLAAKLRMMSLLKDLE